MLKKLSVGLRLLKKISWRDAAATWTLAIGFAFVAACGGGEHADTPSNSELEAGEVQVPAAETDASTDTAPMAYPAKAVAIYHMMWSNSGSPRLAALPAGVNVVNLAFAQGDPLALVGWASQSEASFIADAKALRERGVRIVLSVGGAGGNLNVASRQAFVDGVMAINAKVPLDGLDWDAEGPAMTLEDVKWISLELKRRRGSNFAITMAPNGSNKDEYRAVAVVLHEAGALDMTGQQFYDAEVSYSAANGTIDALVRAGVPESKIGIGMMVDSDARHWTVDECVEAVNYLKSRHPTLRGGYLWEHGRAGTAEWASRVAPLLLAP